MSWGMKQKARTNSGGKNLAEAAAAPDQLAAKGFLRAFHPSLKPALYQSVGLTLLDGVMLVTQAWMLAAVIHHLVFVGAELDEKAEYFMALPVVFLLRALLSWWSRQSMFCATQKLKQSIRAEALQHLSLLGAPYVARMGTGKLTHLMGDGIEALTAYFSSYLPAKFTIVLLPLIIVVAVAPFDSLSMAIMLTTAPMIPFFMILIGKRTQKRSQKQWQRMARMSGYFLDRLQGIVSLKLLGAAKREVASIQAISEAYRKDTMSVLRIAFLSSLVLELLATLSIAMVAILIGHQLFAGEISLLHGLFVLLLVPEFYLPLRQMGTHHHARMDAIAAAEQMVALWQEGEAAAQANQSGQKQADRTPPALHFDRVSLTYPEEQDGQRRYALKEISLEVKAGETVALIGASGGGKTSLLSLLLRFVQPDSGSIRVNDVELNELSLLSWRDKIAWMPQQPHLFQGTIAQNIALANPKASQQQIQDAARGAFIDEEISALPKGYETPIGERGVGLSGGQIRRVALARAFLRDAPLVLLDEPTASLDKESEERVIQSLRTLCEGRTVIMVAHRLETLALADRVVRIQSGQEQGEVSAQSLTTEEWEALCSS